MFLCFPYHARMSEYREKDGLKYLSFFIVDYNDNYWIVPNTFWEF